MDKGRDFPYLCREPMAEHGGNGLRANSLPPVGCHEAPTSLDFAALLAGQHEHHGTHKLSGIAFKKNAPMSETRRIGAKEFRFQASPMFGAGGEGPG